MHGCNHLYTQKSDKNDIFNYGGNSEFYGLDYSTQLNKIKTGLEEFKKREIKVRSFFAPNHIYDSNTLKALKDSDIKIGRNDKIELISPSGEKVKVKFKKIDQYLLKGFTRVQD